MRVIVDIWNDVREFRQCSACKVGGELGEGPDSLICNLRVICDIREPRKWIVADEIGSVIASDIALGDAFCIDSEWILAASMRRARLSTFHTVVELSLLVSNWPVVA